jgi:hypothetical protein
MALSEKELEALAVKHEEFGFGQVDPSGFTMHGFGPDGLRAFIAEVRKDDEALIRKFVDAIKLDRHDWEDWPEDSRKAFEELRARLLDSDLSTLTERGKTAWAGVDPQKLREGGAL